MTKHCKVALLAEGVDRNALAFGHLPVRVRSPSSRRAWIEICHKDMTCQGKRSPSSRRAWIEIVYRDCYRLSRFVALLAEGVDRNIRYSAQASW